MARQEYFAQHEKPKERQPDMIERSLVHRMKTNNNTWVKHNIYLMTLLVCFVCYYDEWVVVVDTRHCGYVLNALSD